MDIVESAYCRLCAELTPKTKLFDFLTDSDRSREVVEKLSRLKNGFVNMFRDNDMPKSVCFICLDSLYRAVAFVERIEASQDVLKSILNIKREPTCSEVDSDDDDDDDNDDNSSSFDTDTVKEEKKNVNIKREKEQECRITCKHESKSTKYRKRVKNESSSDDSDSDMTWKDYNWMCAFCKTQFPSAESLRTHAMDCHDSCTAFKCIDCNIRKLKLEPFIAHVMRHRKYLKRSCYTCSMKFTSRVDVERHRRSHLKHKNVCAGCHMSFKYVKELTEHKNKFYTDKRATRIIRPLTEEDLTCKVCEKKFKTRSILQSHILIHTDRRRDHTCDICGKCFYNKDTLMSHLIVHNENRPFTCEICKFSFKTIGQLRMHVGTHDGQRPFACEQCGKSFRLRKNLTSHMIIHSDTLPFTCEYCNKGFRFKTILNQHIRQHTGVKPYSCSLCQRAFTNWSNYNKHMKRRHGMEMAKKKHTPEGVFPINPVTGEVVINPLPDNTEEWKQKVLQRRLLKRPEQSNKNSQTANSSQVTSSNMPHMNVTNSPNVSSNNSAAGSPNNMISPIPSNVNAGVLQMPGVLQNPGITQIPQAHMTHMSSNISSAHFSIFTHTTSRH